MFEINEITTTSEMDKLRGPWNDLVDRSRNAGVFQTWEWLSTCRKYFGHGRRLSVICVRDGDRLLGLAPLETSHVYGSPLRRLQFIGGEVSDYLDVIADAEHEDAVIQSMFIWLESNHGHWDVLDMQQIPPDSALIRYQPAPNGYCCVLGQEICPYMPLPESWDVFLSGLGKKSRWNLNYYERRARKEFDMEMRPLGRKELDEGMEAFFELHQRRWRRRWLPGIFYSGTMKQFHKEVAGMFLDNDWLRLHGIRLDGEFKAVLYCFAHKHKAYYYLGGFEPELAKYSLGTVLTGHAIKDAIDRGLTEFDFLRGNEPYKTRWTQESRTNARLIARKHGTRSALAASTCRLEHRVQTRVKDWLHGRFGNG
jgi:CelD/BcsL family acetyltransferase involved in cellulose biosynthesis